MYFSHTHRAAFVHIPKCGGTTVRKGFEPICDESGEDWPQSGDFVPYHLPLDALERWYPKKFALLMSYRSYALVRDPAARFPSAVGAYVTNRLRERGILIDADSLLPEVRRVMRRLTQDPQTIEADLTPFIPQHRYVFRGGGRAIDAVYSLPNMGRLFADLSAHCGHPVPQPQQRHNPRLNALYPPAMNRIMTRLIQAQGTGWLRAAVLRMRPLYRPLLAPFKRTVTFDWLMEVPDVRAFVAEFYARDAELYRSICAAEAPHAAQRLTA